MRNRRCGFSFAALISFSILGATGYEGVEKIDTSHYCLKEVNVTAQKVKSSIKSSVPLQKIDSENILKAGITDIGDAMRRMAGINLRDYGGSGGLKTVSVRGLGAQHTGVIYDGAPLSDLQTGQIDLSRYSLENINSIAINIGDADDIFSTARVSSAAANISINTLLSPDLLSPEPQLTAKFRIASFKTYNPYLRFSKSNGTNLAFSVTADFLHSLNNYPFTIHNGSQNMREKRQNSLINSGHAEVGFLWKPLPSQTLRFKGYFYENARQLPGPVIYYVSSSQERLRERNAFSQIDYVGRLSSKFSIKAIAKYNWSSTRYKDSNGKYPGGILDDYYIQNEEYVATSLMFTPLSDLRFSYSIDYFHNHLTDNKSTDRHPSRDSYLQCLSGQFKLWRLNMTARTVWSIINDFTNNSGRRNNSKLAPSISFSLQPLELINWNVRLSYKNLFRMPSFNELYFDHYGTVNLNPENTDQFNIGMTYSLSEGKIVKSLAITLDGYLNHIKNKIVAVPYNMFIWTMSNLGKVRSIGSDITLAVDFSLSKSNDILLNCNYSYLRCTSRTNPDFPDWNKQLPYTPLNSGAWSITWLNPWVNIVAHGTGCSSRYSTSSNNIDTRMSGFMEIGFSIYREFRIQACIYELKADIINAFNKQYEIVRRYPMPGRSFNLTIGFRLN